MKNLTKEQIEKPFSSHQTTLREMYVLEGFKEMMESLIECLRREIADNPIIDIEYLRRRQGELEMAKKILVRSEVAFKNNLIKTKSLEDLANINNIQEVKL